VLEKVVAGLVEKVVWVERQDRRARVRRVRRLMFVVVEVETRVNSLELQASITLSYSQARNPTTN
jgi:hypothetical protein